LIVAKAGGTEWEQHLSPKVPTVAAFKIALTAVARRCFLADDSGDICAAESRLVEDVLLPLGARIPTSHGVLEAMALMCEDDELLKLLGLARPGLGAFFAHFAGDSIDDQGQEASRSRQWTTQSALRFWAKLNLAAELSHGTFCRFLSACAHYEPSRSEGNVTKLSFQGFLLLVVVVAEYVHSTIRRTPKERIAVFLVRMAVVDFPGAQELRSAARTYVR